jgi:LysR family cyn operon transcriptional activator
MELWQLRTFQAVAENLNFTRAAESLHLTQSAVSHQIKALEAEFGEPLFIRAKRGVILTAAGKIALEYTVRILDEAEAMREKIAGRQKSLTGRVRVAAATQALVYLFAPTFEAFMEENENIELLFRTTVSTEQTITDVLEGTADVGFASMPTYSPALKVVELVEDELVLVVGKKHRLAQAGKIKSQDLENERWILFERGASIRRATDAFFKKLKLEPEKALESNDTYFIKMMIEKGLGISLLPSWAIREEVRQGKLVLKKIQGYQLKRAVSIVSIKGLQPAPTRAFIAHILGNKAALQAFALNEK